MIFLFAALWGLALIAVTDVDVGCLLMYVALKFGAPIEMFIRR